MREYRIKEKNNFFIIEVKKLETKRTGFLWLKKSVIESWEICNSEGEPFFEKGYLCPLSTILVPFESLKDAREKIEEFKKEEKIIYHY